LVPVMMQALRSTLAQKTNQQPTQEAKHPQQTHPLTTQAHY
jgi:hypothetical protein